MGDVAVQGYVDAFPPEQQVEAEEWIAAHIFEHPYSEDEFNGPASEEACAELGKEILFEILSRFRPDLISDADKLPMILRRQLTYREGSTILAALRDFQRRGPSSYVVDHLVEIVPLGEAEIDALCEELNTENWFTAIEPDANEKTALGWIKGGL